MDTWTRDQFLATIIVLGTMLFVVLLVLLHTLLKTGEFDNLFDKLIRLCHVLVPKSTPLARRIHYEDETRNQQPHYARVRRTLKVGKRGRLSWQFSKKYLEQLNKSWNDRYAEEMRKKPFVVYENETTQYGSPGGNWSEWQLRREVKWNASDEVFWFERNESLNNAGLCHQCVPIPRLPKPILKKPRRKPVKPVRPIYCMPETRLMNEQEKQCQPSHGFKYVTKSLLSFLDNTPSDGLNEVEMGLEPTSVQKPGQYQYVTKTLLSFLDWPSVESAPREFRLPEEVV